MGMTLEEILEELKGFKQTVRFYLEVNKLESDEVENLFDDLEASLKDAKGIE